MDWGGGLLKSESGCGETSEETIHVKETLVVCHAVVCHKAGIYMYVVGGIVSPGVDGMGGAEDDLSACVLYTWMDDLAVGFGVQEEDQIWGRQS